MLIQKICNFCHTNCCRISCTSSSLPSAILEYLCVTEKPHQSMILLALYLSAFLLASPLTRPALLLLCSFTLLPRTFMSRWWAAAACQVPSDPALSQRCPLLPFLFLRSQIAAQPLAGKQSEACRLQPQEMAAPQPGSVLRDPAVPGLCTGAPARGNQHPASLGCSGWISINSKPSPGDIIFWFKDSCYNL